MKIICTICRSKSLVAAVLLALSPLAQTDENYFYISIGVGKNMSLYDRAEDMGWEDAGGIFDCKFSCGYNKHLGNNWHLDANYSHYSQCDEGPPVNDNPELSLDSFMLEIEERFY